MVDQGKHYRFTLKVRIGEADAQARVKIINLDPFRVAQVWGMSDFALQTVLKKIARAGQGGHKDFKQDLLDCICALERRVQMLDEDEL